MTDPWGTPLPALKGCCTNVKKVLLTDDFVLVEDFLGLGNPWLCVVLTCTLNYIYRLAPVGCGGYRLMSTRMLSPAGWQATC